MSGPNDERELPERGSGCGAPPWILGHRGAPRVAPENTLSSLDEALELGLDGVEYDLQRCATGEAVLLHDDTLDRTTDGEGAVGDWTLPELSRLDAGSSFSRAFAGEPVPLLEEALALAGPDPSETPMHMIELKDPRLVDEVARALAELPRPLPVRIASFHRSVCLEARDAGLAAMLLAVRAEEDDRRFVRDERLAAHGVGPGGWRAEAGRAGWSCERWSWSVDDPRDLLAACREPLFGFNTNEPLRALAVRALVALTPGDVGPYPLDVPPLEVFPGALAATRGEWCGGWELEVGLRNPFPFAVEVELELAARGGVYEVRGLPAERALAPGARTAVPLALRGGSWSPGNDPEVVARFRWSEGDGPEPGALVLDAPLRRVRSLSLGAGPRRVRLLKERPQDPEATMVVRRRGPWLVCAIESAGRLDDARALVHLAGETRLGARGVRVPLAPELTGPRPLGSPSAAASFCCGIEGRAPDGTRRVRRWAGGLPPALESGSPGWITLNDRA